jgi:hypothetical protein
MIHTTMVIIKMKKTNYERGPGKNQEIGIGIRNPVDDMDN